MTSLTVIPDGFTPIFMVEPFTTLVGPIYSKPDGADMFRLGFRVVEAHLNIERVVHGGMLSTVADQAIGVNVAHANNQSNDVLTIHLSVDFISPAVLDDWVEASVTLSKISGRVRFGNCELRVGDRLVLKASAIFTARVHKGK
ncbi:MAG: PaaI family thioesterase [Alcaligenaceae bacterium]|jgi:acyl-coenzyme A thioesterase 13